MDEGEDGGPVGGAAVRERHGQEGSGRVRNRVRASVNWASQGQRRGKCSVRRRAERVSRPVTSTRRLLSLSKGLQGREQHEQVAHPVSLVLVIVGHGCPGPRREGRTGLLHQLLAGLVQAHQDLIVLVFTMIDLQHVLQWRTRIRCCSEAGGTSTPSAKA